MNRLFAVSDLHGFLGPFQEALRQAGLVDEDHHWSTTSTDLVVLGDVIDRGPDSKGVVSYLLQLVAEIDAAGGELRVLLGNHEQMLIQGPHHQAAGQCWWENGGVECLESYGIAAGEQYEPAHTHAIMQEHREFFLGLDSYLVHGDTLLVHAGAPVNRRLEDPSVSD